MTSLTLDGSTRYVGTEFIKLLNTGSSNLATEQFVNDAVEAGGGGGGADLTNYYDKSETDNLLNAKLNINNPQDMAGTLRIGHILGNSKIILNAIASDKDFYVNGDAQVNGNMNVLSLDSTGYVQCANVIASSDVKTDIIDSNGANDLTLKRNTFDICYLRNSSLELNAGINLVAPAQVQANTYNSFDDSSTLFLRNDVEFMRFRKTEDDILVSKDIQGVNLTVSGEVKTNVLNSDGLDDIVLKRNNANIASLTATDFKTETGIDIISNGEVKCNKFESVGNANVEFYRNGNKSFSLQQSVSGFAYPAIVQPTDFVFITDKIFCDELRNRYNNKDFLFWGGNTAGNARINYLTYRPASEDVLFYRSINIDTGYKLISPIVSSPSGANLVIQRGGVDYMSLAAGQVQLSTNIQLVGDTITGDTVNSEDFYANTINVRHATQDMIFNSGNTAGNGRINIMTFRRLLEDVMFYRDVNIDTGMKLITDTISSPDATNLTIERGGVNYMNFTDDRISIATGILVVGDVITANSIHGDDCFANRFRVRHMTEDSSFDGANTTEDGRISFMVYRHLLEDLRILKNVIIDAGKKISSNIYDSSTNADVYFKRNDIDYIQLGGTSLRTRMLTGCQSDIYDSLGNSDVSFRRNGIDFFYLRNGMLELNTNIDLSTDVVNSKGNADIAFERNSVEYFKLTVVNTEPFVMLGDTVNISAKECYANEFSNRSFNQDTLFYGGNTTDNGRIKYMEYKHHEAELNIVSDATIETGKTLTGELVDTSSEKLKYDIEDANINFKQIVQGIKPKTFRMKVEQDKGINKNHIGFIAENVEQYLPEEIENIIIDTHDVKKLNYVKLTAFNWGATQELIKENEELKNKVEHLESRLFEVENFIKDFVKPKTRAKASTAKNRI